VRSFGELDEILGHLGDRRLDDAQQKLNFYLFENTECPMGRMAAAAICLHHNLPADALEQLQSVYLRQPSNTMALYALGHCYERLQKEAQAIEFYQDCVKFKSHLQLPRQRMAAIYYKNGRLPETVEQYEALSAEHPEDISSLVLLGYLHVANRQYEAAVATFNMAILSHPDNFHDENHEDQIRDLVDAGQYDSAIENVHWMMDEVGEMPELYVRMGDINGKAGRIVDAIANYENAIRIQPDYLEATIKLGTHYLRSGKPVLAAEQFNRAVEINDDIVDAYFGLAAAQQLNKHTAEAHSTLSLAAAIQQNSTLLFSETAMLHLQNAFLNEASGSEAGSGVFEIEDVVRAHHKQLVERPWDPDIHYRFGMLMMVSGDMVKAAQSFENALRINSTHHRARTKLVLCLHETDHASRAIENLTMADPITQETIRLHYDTALLYCDKARFGQALVNLEHKMSSDFSEPEAANNIQVVLENLGLVDRALATWNRLSEIARAAIGARYR
jgi:tetratricopeptide (TPR) repeat protein